ncbi:bifunctional (p)ppGpp synthetase/guanosine-3',5'-bis(diphosphate) 3'-pyrophosphohydrolase [bacterium]|nr:bifunctional (p)ppGpp synthetase/guanosine-3',5'-bis(diphosphate) 3'-pyrophosphohydrolase [candidate division CSSED10-310 bacterium]
MATIQQLIEKYLQYSGEPEGAANIQKAYEMAQTAHEGQKRRSKKPYIVHPLSAACFLAELELDWEVICAALLHDTVEDTYLNSDMIREALGPTVASLVESVTKIKTEALSRLHDQKEAEIESMRKIILGTTQDLRVILIKLADRWDNLSSLEHLSRDRQKAIASETLAIYTPFANRLGLSVIRTEMEDLCFKYLKPRQYMKYSQRLAISKRFLKSDVEQLTRNMKQHLDAAKIPNDIVNVYLTPYRLYIRSTRKLQPKTLEMNISTENPSDCYLTLGVIHEKFTPLSSSMIRDFIAVPRSNGYQALHTKILFNENIYSIRIRTKMMNRIARFGILAKVDDRQTAGFQTWIDTLKDLVTDETDSRRFIRSIRDAAEDDRISVCTPRGDYWSFPPNAIVLDFAYRIHTDIGQQCESAFIDGQPADIYDELRDGSMVRIITSTKSHPKSEWLSRVKTPRARTAIRNWLDVQKRKWSCDFGHKMLAADLQLIGVKLEDFVNRPEFREYLERSGSLELEDFYSKIGRGIISTREIISQFASIKDYKKALKKDDSKLSLFLPRFLKENKGRVYQIRSIDDVHIKLSRCCNPLPGDDIVGILSKQHGVSVHRSACDILKKHKLGKDQLLQLSWNLETEQKHIMHLQVKTENRQSILLKILTLLSERRHSLSKFCVNTSPEGYSIEIDLETLNTEQANLTTKLIQKIKGVQKTLRH